MKKFKFYYDTLVEVWKRTPFTVTAENEKKAKEIASKFALSGVESDDNVEFDHYGSELLSETEETITAKENDNQPTVEILYSDLGVLADNRETNRKEVRNNLLDIFADARRNYIAAVRQDIKAAGGELPVSDGNNDEGEPSPLSIVCVDDNNTGVDSYLIDKVKVDENGNILCHVSDCNDYESGEWYYLSTFGDDDIYILENIVWR